MMKTVMLEKLLYGIFVLFLAVSARSPGYAAPPPSARVNDISETALIKTDEILRMNAKMRSMVDQYIKPIIGTERRAQALYDLMFKSDRLALKYDNSYTKTAAETVDSGSGNCISLASTFIAMGRYAGLDVKYLHFEVPVVWQRETDFYYQYKHISAAVRISSGEYLGIDFELVSNIDHVRRRELTDEQGFSAFYCNRGVELLMQDHTDAAMAYLLRAIDLDPDNSNNWSDLGVAYRRLNQLDKAEYAYKRALRKNKSNLSALNNLAILYQMTGRTKIAKKYSKKLERYLKKNPYYMIKLAKQEIEKGNYSKALKWAKKAIKKNNSEQEFYYVAAKAYAYLGKRDKAMHNLELAEKFAHKAQNKNQYSRKLELLRDMKKSRN